MSTEEPSTACGTVTLAANFIAASTKSSKNQDVLDGFHDKEKEAA